MSTQAELIDNRIITQLIKDIGLENTRLFITSLQEEFKLRSENIIVALEEKSHKRLASEAHAFKGMAQTYGATKLGELLYQVESKAKTEDDTAFSLASKALLLAKQTDDAFKTYQFDQ
jgi:HPt (histidine-containing phosphotransfer) domain-containing protein